MNTIESGMDRQHELPLDPHNHGQNVPKSADMPEREVKSHAFSRLPQVGVPDAAAREWALADIEGLRQIAEPKDRVLPLSLMAFNLSDNRQYRSTLREEAPDVEAQVREIGIRSIQQHTGLLHDHRTRVDNEERAKDALARPTSEPVSMEKEEHVPPGNVGAKTGGMTPAQTSASRSGEEHSADEPFVQERADAASREALRKRYLIEGNKYYFRHGASGLAFEDMGKRLATEHDDPDVAKSMVDLAAVRGWTSIKVKGTDEFKQQVWLAASLRGLDVQGYRPSKLDLARRDEMSERIATRPANEIESTRPREKTIGDGESTRHEDSLVRDPASAREKQAPPLTKQQRLAVDTLKEILRSRGDSEVAVQMAADMAGERFRGKRVYVGKVIEHGHARYEHDPDNAMNYFVKLQTFAGERTVWGKELSAAMEARGAKKSDEIAITYEGMKPVTVHEKERDANGKPTGRLNVIFGT